MNNGKLCIPVCAKTADEMMERIRRAKDLSDLIEVRFDCVETDQQIDALLGALANFEGSPGLIATFRSTNEGGMRDATLEDRLTFWKRDLGKFVFADLEDDALKKVGTLGRKIGSFHDFNGIPEQLCAVAAELAERAAIVKLAAAVVDAPDAIPVWNLLKNEHPMIPIAMGEAGKWTRILGLAHGAFLTYASLNEGAETADGQITARDMLEVYRVKELDLDTKVYGIVGDPVSSSFSPYFQNAAFREVGLNSAFVPLLVKDLEAFIRRMVRQETREVELNFAGFSVTMPHKVEIIKCLDEIDPVAEKIGAVNTVVIDDGKLIGHNTDADGFITPLKQQFGDLKGVRVAVVGAGGAARACCYALREEGAETTVLTRDEGRASHFHDDLGCAVVEFQNGELPSGFDVVVNATSVGMKGPLEDEVLFTADQLSGVRFVFDLVTRAGGTPLMREAELAGIKTLGGDRMLLAQGMRQFELWTGRQAPAEAMWTALHERLSEQNK